ncbi:MAG: glutamate decarboxylase [Neisseriales bacterium]|nr:MAG: glutamate decarboxylase [Neisseriales bacterium]
MRKFSFPEKGLPQKEAYHVVKKQLEPDAHPNFNLAVFATSEMDEYATKIINENLAVNFPNATQYPNIAEINQKVALMLADLWNIGEDDSPWGSSTVGSSEAIFLATLAAKTRFQEQPKNLNKMPNIVFGANAHTAWYKAANYQGIEIREVPVRHGKFSVDASDMESYIDANTILVVGVAGSHQTGYDDDLISINSLLEQLEQINGWNIPLHIDAALSGFIYPFIRNDYVWDFRLSKVMSINASGHKYGLVYTSVGWLVIRNKAYIPESIIYKIKYLGGEFEQFTLNFSRGSSSMLAQYYNLLHLGYDGYLAKSLSTIVKAHYLVKEFSKLDVFEFVYPALFIPMIVIHVKHNSKFTIDNIAQFIQKQGWHTAVAQLSFDPSYPKIMKIIIRDSLTTEMLENLVSCFKLAINSLTQG